MHLAHHHLARAIADGGISAHEPAIARLVADLRRHEGVNPVLVDILEDARAPGVARERALGRLLADLDRPVPHRPVRSAA